ncbi:hypothetical protein SESBI_36143 [Sesbania bispinosa]|nr:hypothetical protein SESBI_36143 [Sesbania bispinosa]
MGKKEDGKKKEIEGETTQSLQAKVAPLSSRSEAAPPSLQAKVVPPMAVLLESFNPQAAAPSHQQRRDLLLLSPRVKNMKRV